MNNVGSTTLNNAVFNNPEQVVRFLLCTQRLGRLGVIRVQVRRPFKVVAKGDARGVGDREFKLFQICQSTSLPGLSVNFLDDEINKINPTLIVTKP